MYRDHRRGPGGPPGGATCPGGHMGCRGCALAYMGQGHQPLEAHAPKGQEEKNFIKELLFGPGEQVGGFWVLSGAQGGGPGGPPGGATHPRGPHGL